MERREQERGRLRKCKGEGMHMEQGVGADGREWTKSSEEGGERREWELAFIG